MAEQRSSGAASQEELAKQIEQLRADVADITRTLGELGKGQVTDLRSRAEQRAAEMRARGRAVADDVGARVRDVEHEAEDYIREKPLQALAIAAGLGLLVGWLTRR